MEIKDVAIWKPIEFSEAWERCSTSKLDVLLPSWVRRRQTLKEDSKAYNQFMERLKRQHAIETGVIEKLYDLSEGVTETFIKEGFVESYLQHGDTNIPPHQLMNYLNDNFSAIDFVFDVVKNNRTFTVSFIKELHQLITRHQDTAEGRDQFGNRKQIALLKGKFKEWENNPTRSDGTRFLYCPPIHVDAEMDKLVEILADLEGRKVHPLLIATWLHHAFVAIHPFQDGNGRVARLLASLVLIKNELFPLTVKRMEKKRYIDNLELADNGQPQGLVDYFGEMQKKNIEGALNMRLEVDLAETSLAEIVGMLDDKLTLIIQKESEVDEDREMLLMQRIVLFNNAKVTFDGVVKTALDKIKNNVKWEVFGDEELSDNKDVFARHIAIDNKYHYNDTLPHGTIYCKINILEKREYALIISLHHFGNDDSGIAVGALLASQSIEKNYEKAPIDFIPLQIAPFTTSLDTNLSMRLREIIPELKIYFQNILTLTLAQIASEINP
ncbi:MAG: Fic family protein [Saprospiraceae bacterium]|nr:Fic family protein [Saprospiraceae bacterium]